MPDDFTEKGKLIETILDRIKPIPVKAPDDVKDAIDGERQLLAMRAGWNNMTVAQLRALVSGSK